MRIAPDLAGRLYTLLQPESLAALAKIPADCVNRQSSDFGLERHEPLLFGLDGLLRYAKAYQKRFEGPLAEDGPLGKAFMAAANGYRRLLDGDGAAAYEYDRSTDSKDNGALWQIFEATMNAAGFKPEDWQ